MKLNDHKGFGMTAKEFAMYRAKAYARQDVLENQKKFQTPITDADVAYMVKALDATDVNQFLAVV